MQRLKGPDAAWLVTPVAMPCPYETKPCDLSEAVDLCLALATTLSQLHSRGIAHRDIKPSNIFRLDGCWVLGDFGIASFPHKPKLTAKGEKLGPIHYIAPEMLNDADDADWRSADVYAVAKLLWKLAEGEALSVSRRAHGGHPKLGGGPMEGRAEHQSSGSSIGTGDPIRSAKPSKMEDVRGELADWRERLRQTTLSSAPELLKQIDFVRSRLTEEDADLRSKLDAAAALLRSQERENAPRLVFSQSKRKRSFLLNVFRKMSDIAQELRDREMRVGLGPPNIGLTEFGRALLLDWDPETSRYGLHQVCIEMKLVPVSLIKDKPITSSCARACCCGCRPLLPVVISRRTSTSPLLPRLPF